MAAAQRIYVIRSSHARDPAGNEQRPRLVRAPNAAQALRLVADEFIVALASQDDLVALTEAGVKVESAADPTARAST